MFRIDAGFRQAGNKLCAQSPSFAEGFHVFLCGTQRQIALFGKPLTQASSTVRHKCGPCKAMTLVLTYLACDRSRWCITLGTMCWRYQTVVAEVAPSQTLLQSPNVTNRSGCVCRLAWLVTVAQHLAGQICESMPDQAQIVKWSCCCVGHTLMTPIRACTVTASSPTA